MQESVISSHINQIHKPKPTLSDESNTKSSLDKNPKVSKVSKVSSVSIEPLRIRKPRSEHYFLANNNKHAIVGGVYYSTVAFIERILEDLSSVIEQDYKVFITGSDSDKIFSMLDTDDIDITADNNLIWNGMLSLL